MAISSLLLQPGGDALGPAQVRQEEDAWGVLSQPYMTVFCIKTLVLNVVVLGFQ